MPTSGHRFSVGLKTALVLLALASVASFGCTDVGKDKLETMNYETHPMSIYNPDWGILPLPNNLLNPAQQSGYLSIPGVEPVDPAPTQVNLPYVDEAALALADDLGYMEAPYGVELDDPLTASLKKGGLLTHYLREV